MDRSSIEFASLLASRLCHDLLSPVGAMNNGLELLADETDPAMREQCMDLLADSARTTAAKLKFFRLAFGAAGGFEDEIDTREAKAVIDGLIGGHSRTELDWMVSQPTMTKGRLKVLLNLSMIALEALVRGGRLSIGGEGDEIVIRAEGERIVLDPEIRAVLGGRTSADALTPRTSAAWLAQAVATEEGGEIRVSEPEDKVLLLGATFAA